jgi:hypothetical protein
MDPIVQFDVDEATYIGDEEDGVYYQVGSGEGGWYMTAVVDCDSAGFVDNLVVDDGPYISETEALRAGKSCAIDWCLSNDISYQETD